METKEQSKIQKLMKSKPAKAGVSVALVGTLALAGIGAYFTGTDTVENKFDISAGLTDKITVVEENWDTTDADTNGIPDAAEHVVPLQTIAKDPVVKNESDVEAWLFCQIKVPTANVSVVGDDIDGNTIEEVVPNIEHLPAQDTTPLTSTPEIITYVDGTTPTAPESTVNWFKDMSEVEKIDISGMNTDGTVDMTGMFSGDTKLQSIKIGESTDIATVVPKDFVLDAYVYSNPWKNPEKLIVTPTTANHDSMNFSIQNLTGQSVYGE